MDLPSITGVVIERELIDDQIQPRPVIYVDLDKIGKSTEYLIATDLVRSLAVATAYPEADLERRVKVYNDAMDVQRGWVNDENNQDNRNQHVLFNPNMVKRDQLIRGLLGDAAFFCDVGFADWQHATALLQLESPESTRVLNEVHGEKNTFIQMRDTLTTKTYEKYSKLKDFVKQPAEMRAGTIASYYVSTRVAEKAKPVVNRRLN